jgi:hypothetical protein
MLFAYMKKSSPGFLVESMPVMTTRLDSLVLSVGCWQPAANSKAEAKYNVLFIIVIENGD